MKPHHWITPEKRTQVTEIWVTGNDFTMQDIAQVVGVTERQVRYAVRSLQKTALQRARHDSAARAGR